MSVGVIVLSSKVNLFFISSFCDQPSLCINDLIELNTSLGLIIIYLLAALPTTAASNFRSGKRTTEGIVFLSIPSTSKTLIAPFTQIETHEFVVPRSTPK